MAKSPNRSVRHTTMAPVVDLAYTGKRPLCHRASHMNYAQYLKSLPHPLRSCELQMVVKENPDRKKMCPPFLTERGFISAHALFVTCF